MSHVPILAKDAQARLAAEGGRWKPALNAFELTFEGRLTQHTDIN